MPLSLQELTKLVDAGTIDTVVVADTDMQGRLYGKRLSARHFLNTGIDGVPTCSVVLGWGQDHSLDSGYEFTGWDTGYPDFISVPDMNTLRHCDWQKRTAIVLADAGTLTKEPVEISPRAILKRQLEKCSAMGFESFCVSELEFFLLRESPDTLYDKGFTNIHPRHQTMHPETVIRTSEDEDYMQKLRNALENSGIEVEMVKAEYSPGQVEINLAYTNALLAADSHVLMKTAAKEIALQSELVASFMAKIDHTLGGSSCHVHLSMRNSSGDSVFDDGKGGMSDTMQSFLAGIVQYSRDFFLFFAPTTNSYKRMVPDTFAPARIGWGQDNRTVAFRVVGQGIGKRIENRIPGADINPYLAYSAMLACGLYGIESNLKLDMKPQDGNAYGADDGVAIPSNLEVATEAFANSKFVAEMLGERVQSHYASFGRNTSAAMQYQVTDVERKALLLDI